MPKMYAQTAQDTLKPAQSKTEKQQQENYKYNKEVKIGGLQQELEDIKEAEKYELKKRISEIDAQLEKGEVTTEKAQALKEEAAKRAAQNIDNKTAIIQNQIALVQRDVNYNYQPYSGAYLNIGLGQATDNKGSFLLGLEYNAENLKPRRDRRTDFGIVLASGFGNAIGSGHNIGSVHKFWSSGYFEVGISLKTRLLKESNTYRLSYGLSYQNTMLGLKDNHYVNNGGVTELQDFPYKLKNSQFRVSNFVVPVMLEFGPSVKKEYKDYYRYDTNTSFKVGIGGYAGINTSAVQRLKYKLDGEYVVNKNRADYNVNKFVYGVQAYVGYGAISLFAKYDLNPVFENAATKLNTISFGTRLDL